MSRDKIFGRMGNQPPRPPSIALDRMGKLIEAGHLVMFHAEEDLVFEVVSVGPVLHPGAPAGQAIQIMLAAQFPVMTQAATPNRGFVIVGESKTRLDAQAKAANNGNGELERAYESAVVGENPPGLAVAGGAVLNKVTGTDDHDPEQTYVVTPEKIEQIEHDHAKCGACGATAGMLAVGQICNECGDGVYRPGQDWLK